MDLEEIENGGGFGVGGFGGVDPTQIFQMFFGGGGGMDDMGGGFPGFGGGRHRHGGSGGPNVKFSFRRG